MYTYVYKFYTKKKKKKRICVTSVLCLFLLNIIVCSGRKFAVHTYLFVYVFISK